MNNDEDRISEVLAVLPNLTRAQVKSLLAKYNTVETVVNHCLDGLVEDDLAAEVVDVESSADTTVSTVEYNRDNKVDEDFQFEEFKGDSAGGSYDFGVSCSFTKHLTEAEEEEPYEPFEVPNYAANEDLPDIPEAEPVEDAFSVSNFQSTSANTVEAPKKRGRKKKQEKEKETENLIQNNKKKRKRLPTTANIEVQLGPGLYDQSNGIGNVILKALEVSGGVFEKNAILPCPCDVFIWEDAIHPMAVRWIYNKPCNVLDNDDEHSSDAIYAAPGSEFCAELQPELCLILPLDDFMSLCRPARTNDLILFCRRLISGEGFSAGYRRLIILTPDPDHYFKQRQADSRRHFRRKLTNSGLAMGPGYSDEDVSIEDVEMAIASLDFAEPPLTIPVTVTFSTSTDHTAAIIRCITKSIYERPAKVAKRQWDSALLMEPGSTVNPAEKPYELWCRQLEQLSLVSSDVASAIASRFPTPMSLHCAATSDGCAFSSNLEIRRGAGVLERTRRVGPETSRRLHMLFTTGVDPETVFE